MENQEEEYKFEEWEKKILRFDGHGNVWSHAREMWLTPREWAAEKRHSRRWRAIHGSNEEVAALNVYEQQIGMQDGR